jgi:23S rRNA (uracil1939-C5)-methyltransferase
MRARFHVHSGRAGFYREGTHQLCDATATRQLRPDTASAVAAVAAALHQAAPGAAASIAVAENLPGNERAAHVETAPDARLTLAMLERAAADANLRGLSARDLRTGQPLVAGLPIVSDTLQDVTAGRVPAGTLQRHAESFFQANRYLLPGLVTAVLDAVPGDGEVVDLYAGVGLFSVALAAAGRLRVTAVEGDRASGADLRENARPHAPRAASPATLIVDPPRTGVSKDAGAMIVRMAPARIVYVSCDPPTLARDARRFIDAGYRLESLRAFDLFPNTPHVEALAVFTRAAAARPRPPRTP